MRDIIEDTTAYNLRIINDGVNVAAGPASKSTLIMPIPLLAGLANAQTLKMPVNFNFTLTAVRFRVQVPATTAAKLATATAQISGVACTGGVIGLTSANCTPSGAAVAGSAITALNTGAAGATVEMAISAVTAFAEGGGWFEFDVTNRSLGL